MPLAIRVLPLIFCYVSFSAFRPGNKSQTCQHTYARELFPTPSPHFPLGLLTADIAGPNFVLVRIFTESSKHWHWLIQDSECFERNAWGGWRAQLQRSQIQRSSQIVPLETDHFLWCYCHCWTFKATENTPLHPGVIVRPLPLPWRRGVAAPAASFMLRHLTSVYVSLHRYLIIENTGYMHLVSKPSTKEARHASIINTAI